MADSSSSSSSSLAAKSDVETEELLDRMLTRLALCDDSKLEALLSKLLLFTLSSLSSQSTAVRNKVLEILSHVNKRVKHQSEIGLPLLELWKLYIDPNANPMVKNFCIVYIEMAFERVHVNEKENMAPILVVNICKLPHQHQEIILRIATKVIGECHAHQINDEVALKYKSVNGSEDRELFIEFCFHLMLYQQPSQGGGCPPGLSIAQCNRVTGKHPLKNDVLLMRKLGILNVIEAMELDPELVYPLFLAASADCQEPVIKRGEELLKKKASTANLDDPKLMNKLFLLFNGTAGAENVAAESRVAPASVSLKAKLMSIFCRSIRAANSFPATLQCTFGCIYGSGTTSRLRHLGMEFTVWVFKHVITRINYGQSVYISGLAGAVSLAGSGGGLWAIEGGNWQMADGLINMSNVELHLNEEIHSISYFGDYYELNSTKGRSYTCGVTAVATPLDESNIRFTPSISVPERQLQHTHATFVRGLLSPAYFGLRDVSEIPELVGTIEDPELPFSSISILKQHNETDMTYKLFSRKKMPDSLLDSIFSVRKETIRINWGAYPQYKVPEVFAPFILDGHHLYYVNAFENAASTMETSAVAAENVARLILSRKFGEVSLGSSSFTNSCSDGGVLYTDL